MAKPKSRHSLFLILDGIGWPLLWGLAATIGFYALIQQGLIRSALAQRYFAGHPVEYIETGMFFVGVAALLLKAIHILTQLTTLDRIELTPAAPEGQKPADSAALLQSLSELPAAVQNSYLVRRLQDALEYVRRKGSADQLDDELKYLSDVDAARLFDGYGLVRIIIWATPMLGFLGTVIGITLALADLSPEALVNSPKDAMEGLLAGLSVAFDTTALALLLSIVLMFAQFLTSQLETQLLSAVDARTSHELVGRFEQLGSRTDPHAASIHRVAETVVRATEQLVQRQAELWQGTIDEAHATWSQLVDSGGRSLLEGLSGAVRQSVEVQRAQLAESEDAAGARLEQYWHTFQHGLAQNAQLLESQQEQMIRQADVMHKVVAATGEVIQLERALNDNLQSLAGAKNFEDTIMSLSAAIHLLNTRLNDPARQRSAVELDSSESQGKAA